MRRVLCLLVGCLCCVLGLRSASAQSTAGAAVNVQVAQPAAPGPVRADATVQPSSSAQSEFATWEQTVIALLPDLKQGISDLCKSDSTWCGEYGPAGSHFDLAGALQSRPVRLSLYLGTERADLVAATAQVATDIAKNLNAAPVALDSQKPKAKNPNENKLEKLQRLANGTTNDAVTPPPLSAGGLPGVDLNALAEKILNGIAIALEQRAEEEAAEFVLDRVQTKLCSETALKQLWFQTTCQVADSLSSTSSQSGLNSLTVLRAALENDLRHLPGRLAGAAIQQPTKLHTAVPHLVDSLIAGTHPVRALDAFARELAPISTDPIAVKLVACAASFPAAIQRFAPMVDAAGRGLSPSVDPGTRGFALAYLSLESSACAAVLQTVLPAGKSLASQVTLTADKVMTLGLDVDALERTLENAQTSLVNLQSADTGELPAAAAALASIAGVALDAARVGKDALVVIGNADSVSTFSSTWEQLEPTVTAVQSIAQSVAARDYGMAIATLLQSTCDSSCVIKVSIPPVVKQYLGLVIAIVQAKTADDVSNALLAAAAPANSWRAKFDGNALPLVTLGGMVGVGASSSAASGTPKWEGRLTAPVGVDWVFAGGSALNFGVFAQLVDVGAYVRAGHDTAMRAPRVLEAVSPGLALRVGLFSSPVVLGVGGAYDFDAGSNCALSNVCDDGKPYPGGFRFMSWLALDVPLFVLHRN